MGAGKIKLTVDTVQFMQVFFKTAIALKCAVGKDLKTFV